MKNLIIAGISRSGKSALSKRLSNELRFSHIPVDSIMSTLGYVFPECGVDHYQDSFDDTCNKLSPFLLELTRQLDFEAINYILDGYHILPAFAEEDQIRERFEIVFLGYPSIDREQKLQEIRQYACVPDWTIEIPDDEMLNNLDKFIAQSRYMQLECERLGLRFIDTSRKFSTTLDAAFRELVAAVAHSGTSNMSFTGSVGNP